MEQVIARGSQPAHLILAAVLAVTIGLGLTPAWATDQPINAASIRLRRFPSGRQSLTFTSRDPNLLFPALTSADNPASGTPGGLLIELFSHNDPTIASFVIPSGVGTPGWIVTDGRTDQYRFANRFAPLGVSPVKSATLRDGKRLTITVATTGLSLAGAQGTVGIRITTGSLRNCALFDAPTIKVDRAGWFFATKAVALALVDCSMQQTPLVRPADPVVLTGADIAALAGVTPSDLVAFRYSGSWTQIPVQVDERATIGLDAVYNHVGGYGGGISEIGYTDAATFTGADPDPTLDADDEIVFMARQAGERAPTAAGRPPGVIRGTGVELRLADPLDGALGYIYLFRQTGTLDPGAGQQYVDYHFNLLSGDYRPTYGLGSGPNPENSSVSTAFYSRHFADRWVQDELRIFAGGASGADILDRHKNLFSPGVCVRSEETFSAGEGAFIVNKSGPVRAIRSYVGANSGPRTQRDHLFYERREDIRTTLRVHSIPGMLDFFDYSAAASGMIYRNDLNADGVTIDGIPDTMASGAPSWEMVSGAQGSLVMAAVVHTDISGLTPSSYYLDNATPPVTQCTGDAFAYGSSGLWFNQSIPNTDPIYAGYNSLQGERIMYYDGPGLTVSDAAQRRSWALNPLQVSASVWP